MLILMKDHFHQEAILPVYRNFTQVELDTEYNVRAGIPDYQEIFDRWKSDSEAFRRMSHFEADLRYGPDHQQSIDLFRTSRSGAPIVVFIHGGYWQSLDKSDFSYIARPYLEDGMNFAAINYRLAPAVSMKEIIEDCRAALVWLHQNASRFNCDEKSIYVTGSSAGGHLTAMMLATDWRSYMAPPDLVKGGCALSGLYDLEPIRLCYLNGNVRLDESDVRLYSPVLAIPSSMPKLLLSVGGDESSEFHRQQHEYGQALRAAGIGCEVIEQIDGHHFDMCDRLGDRNELLYHAVKDMVLNPSREGRAIRQLQRA